MLPNLYYLKFYPKEAGNDFKKKATPGCRVNPKSTATRETNRNIDIFTIRPTAICLKQANFISDSSRTHLEGIPNLRRP